MCPRRCRGWILPGSPGFRTASWPRASSVSSPATMWPRRAAPHVQCGLWRFRPPGGDAAGSARPQSVALGAVSRADLAFKDLALQLLGHLFDAALTRRGEQVTIVGATSGDTGSAALAACRGRQSIDIFFLYPHGRISEVQRRQMTTVDAPNAHAVAIEGTFDDCQDLVKALFADAALRRDLGLSAMNSINFARIAAQIVYYVAAGLALGAPARAGLRSRCRPAISAISMPRIWRGRWGCRSSFWCWRPTPTTSWRATSTSGAMTMAAVSPSLSPSMDIQVASNFERLLFELKGPQRRRRDRRLSPRSAAMARCRPTTRPGMPRASSSPGTGLTTPAPWPRSARPISAPACWSIRTPQSASPPPAPMPAAITTAPRRW